MGCAKLLAAATHVSSSWPTADHRPDFSQWTDPASLTHDAGVHGWGVL